MIKYKVVMFLNKRKIIVALYEPEIPQNVGTIMRTCACFDVFLILIEPMGFLFTDRNFKRSKMDYSPNFEVLPSFSDFYEKYQQSRIILFTPHCNTYLDNFEFQNNDILLFGRESNGVELSIAQKVSAMVNIPMKDDCRSINLAISVSIGLTSSLFF